MKVRPCCLRSARFLPVVGFVWTGATVLPCHLSAQTATPPPVPTVTMTPAVVISMPTEAGKVYQMQASANLQTWNSIGQPVFGTGAPLEQPMAGEGQQFFRLQVLTRPAMGAAPWSLDGTALQFNESNRLVRCDFAANGQGTMHTGTSGKPFTWTWKRPAASEGRVEIQYNDGTRETLQLQFSAPGVGRFSRMSYTGTVLSDTDSGSFGPAPAATAVTVPGSVIGRSIAFCDLPGGSSLTVTNSSGGTRALDGQSTAFNGQWLVTGSTTAQLSVNFSGTHGEFYQFHFTGPQSGIYTRSTTTEGMFRDTDKGTFCLGN